MRRIETSPGCARSGNPAAAGIHGVVSAAGERGTVPRAFAHVKDEAGRHGIALGELIEVGLFAGAGLREREVTGRFWLTDGRELVATVLVDDVVIVPPPSFRSKLEESLS